jgi:ATP-dependent Lon protease
MECDVAKLWERGPETWATDPQSPDYSVQYGYLQTILELPWNEYTQDNFTWKNAQKILERDHSEWKK